jgi:hypothetical protein
MPFDPNEIANPKKTIARRMSQAEMDAGPMQSSSAPKTMSQSDFTSGGPSVRSKDSARKNAKFLEMMKRHQQ